MTSRRFQFIDESTINAQIDAAANSFTKKNQNSIGRIFEDYWITVHQGINTKSSTTDFVEAALCSLFFATQTKKRRGLQVKIVGNYDGNYEFSGHNSVAGALSYEAVTGAKKKENVATLNFSKKTGGANVDGNGVGMEKPAKRLGMRRLMTEVKVDDSLPHFVIKKSRIRLNGKDIPVGMVFEDCDIDF